MEPTDPIEKIEFWREHVRKAQLFEGTQGKYAEQNGISPSKLSYYKGLLNPKPKFTKLVAEVKPEASAPPVKESKSPAPHMHLPDAVWLARFLKEFLR